MFTPIDIQNHSLKTAVHGYSKKETDEFLEEILASYEELYKENRELKDKVSSLSEGIQYYKKMETTLQKALVLAEKTSAETQEAAKGTAEAMLKEAQAKAEAIEAEATAKAEALRKETQAYSEITRSDANRELEATRNHVRKLVQSYENYRLQFKKLAESQIEMLESEHFSIFVPELSEILDNAPNADEVMAADGAVPINVARPKAEAAPEIQPEEVKPTEAAATMDTIEAVAEAAPSSTEADKLSAEEKERLEDEAAKELVRKAMANIVGSHVREAMYKTELAGDAHTVAAAENAAIAATESAVTAFSPTADSIAPAMPTADSIAPISVSASSVPPAMPAANSIAPMGISASAVPPAMPAADSIAPAGISASAIPPAPPKADSVAATDNSQNTSWTNTTPKVNDNTHAAKVTSSVTPDAEAPSPFTFIDTD